MDDGGLIFVFAYCLVGVVCGLICFSIALSKSRDGWGWFFLGFFFGPIAVLVAAAVGSEQTTEVEQAESKPAMPLTGSVADELAKLADLLERGHITTAEFDAQKAKLLG